MQNKQETYQDFAKTLDINIPNFHDKDSKSTYYNIKVIIKRHKDWTVEKTYQEFETFHNNLLKLTIQVPNLPAKTMLFSLSFQEKEQRKQDLEKYLRFLMYRKDIVQTKLFQDFLNFHVQVPQDLEIKEKARLQQNHTFPVYDVHYIPEQQVLFVLQGTHSIKNKVGGFLSGLGSKQIGGSVVCYRSQFQNFEFDPLWKYEFTSGPTKMVWDPKLTVLAIGQMNGNIKCLRVSTEKNYSSYMEYCVIKRHSDQITGLAFNSRTAHLYSISKDKYINVTNIAQEKGQIEEKIFPTILTCLQMDKHNNRLFIGGQDGSVFIYDVTPHHKMQPLHHIHPDGPGNGIVCFNLVRKYLLVGSQQGYVQVYELRDKGKEKGMQPVSTIRFDVDLRSLQFNFQKREIYANNNMGLIVIDSRTGQASKAMSAHYETITKLQFCDQHNILVTCSKDMSVKIWKIRPDKDDELRQYQEEKRLRKEKKKEQENQYKLMESQQRKEEYDDEHYYRDNNNKNNNSSSSSDEDDYSDEEDYYHYEPVTVKVKEDKKFTPMSDYTSSQQQNQNQNKNDKPLQDKKNNDSKDIPMEDKQIIKKKPKKPKRKLFDDDESDQEEEQQQIQEIQQKQQEQQQEEKELQQPKKPIQKKKQPQKTTTSIKGFEPLSQQPKKRKPNLFPGSDNEQEKEKEIKQQQQSQQELQEKQQESDNNNNNDYNDSNTSQEQEQEQEDQQQYENNNNNNEQLQQFDQDQQELENLEYQVKTFEPMRGFSSSEEEMDEEEKQRQQNYDDFYGPSTTPTQQQEQQQQQQQKEWSQTNVKSIQDIKKQQQQQQQQYSDDEDDLGGWDN